MRMTELFGENQSVVGKKIRVDQSSFRVIGVINDSSDVLTPIGTAQKILVGSDNPTSISVAISDPEIVTDYTETVEQVLLDNHGISNADDADFRLRSAQSMIDSISSVTSTMVSLLAGIAAISLVVGGIGIMNIMLVTIAERTKEIGLLKAIGAKRSDILSQFMIEAIVLTTLGGIVGVILGYIFAYLASSLFDLSVAMNMNSIILALSVAMAVGLVFGWYPAKKAAALSPIDALRHE